MNIERVLVYTNRSAWYPQAGSDDHATADLLVDLPAGYNAVTGGDRVSARIEGQRALVRYSQKLPGRYISLAVGRLLQVEERTDAAPVLQAFAVSRTRPEVRETLDLARAILSFFTSEFGPCPYPTLGLVLIEGLTPGGHSPPGMVVVARRPPLLRGTLAEDPGNFSDVPGFFLAHELAHQWWGHGVAGKNYHERWISEAFAQYAAASWIQKSRGEKPFRAVLDRLGDWAFRGNGAGPISLGNRLGRVNEDPLAFRAVVYDKGAYVLHMLRGLVGDDAFQSALRKLQETHRFKKAGTADLRSALEIASGRDLGAYFQEWVFGTTLPRLKVLHRQEHEHGRSTQVEVKAEGLPGSVPLQISVRHEGGTLRTRVELPPEGGRFTIQTPGRARDVSINDDAGLLARIGG
jgi:aminopeptidase N